MSVIVRVAYMRTYSLDTFLTRALKKSIPCVFLNCLQRILKYYYLYYFLYIYLLLFYILSIVCR